MKKVIIFLILIMLSNCNLFAYKLIAHTIRCSDGVVLVLGKVDAIIQTKELIKRLNWQTYFTSDVADRIREEKIEGIKEIEEYYIERIKKEKLKVYELTIKEAQEEGLIPYIENLDLSAAKQLLETFGYRVIIHQEESKKFNLPCDIVIKSAGRHSGSYAYIFINGINYSLNERGYNLVVINPATCEVKKTTSFDTWLHKDNSHKMTKFLREVKEDEIIIAAVKDDAAKRLTRDTVYELFKFGVKGNLIGKRYHTHVFIAKRGLKLGETIEELSYESVCVYLFNQQGEELNLPNSIMLSGTKKDDKIRINRKF